MDLCTLLCPDMEILPTYKSNLRNFRRLQIGEVIKAQRSLKESRRALSILLCWGQQT